MARFLSRSAPFQLRAGTAPSAARELCATRLHNRTPAHPGSAPALPAPVLLSSRPASVRVSPVAAGARELTLGSKPSFLIRQTAARGIRQKISSSLVASTARPALRRDIFPVPQ